MTGAFAVSILKQNMPPRFTDVPDMALRSQSIGGFIINFGAAEFLTLRCVELHLGAQAGIDIRHKKLSERITAAKKSIAESKVSAEQKMRASDLWNEITTLSKVRNRIAHNPLIAGKHATTGALVFSVVDLQKMVPVGSNQLEPLDYSQIAACALRVREITCELSALIDIAASGTP